jgi:hypothetical protein
MKSLKTLRIYPNIPYKWRYKWCILLGKIARFFIALQPEGREKQLSRWTAIGFNIKRTSHDALQFKDGTGCINALPVAGKKTTYPQ